jgi:hypothetical protein
VDTRKKAHDLFAVRIDPSTDRGALESNVAKIGSLESLPGRDDLLLLRVRDSSSAPRATWERIHDALGDVPVVPVMVDERGTPAYPTGRVSVRFKEAPEPRELERFAEGLNLRLVGVNKFVTAQAMFEPKDRTEYLPDIIDSVAADDRVDSAWPESISAYRRG